MSQEGANALARAYAISIYCTAVAALFLLTAVVPLPLPLYFPLLRRWTLGLPAGLSRELSMDFYGRSLFALVLGLVPALLGYVLYRARSRSGRQAPPRPQGLFLCLAYTMTVLFLCASLYAYKLTTRELSPEPLPSWYTPR